MEFRKRVMQAALGCASIAAAGLVLADSTIFNGVTYTCPNTCVVTVKPDGTWSVLDSGGGKVRITYPGRKD
jgi:hypothetical protein